MHLTLEKLAPFLGSYYLVLAVMNAVFGYFLWEHKKNIRQAVFWTVVAGAFTIMASIAYSGQQKLMELVSLPEAFRGFVDGNLANPALYTIGTSAFLVTMFLFRKVLVQPVVAWGLLVLALLLMGLSMADVQFAEIVTKPDNVPIVAMVFLLGYFTWLATAQAVKNDERTARGEDPLEKLNNEKILVWPDLVYTELICMVAVTAVLTYWAVGLQAPLEDAASSVKTPNPSKAPWYFLGLQEMLVYFDPWMAGVVLPSTIVAGLMAIPYLDFNKAGNGYYTINQRKFAYLVFQFGFLELWVTLIILGTFLRGPNWNFFGPYEQWDAHKVVALNNVDLSQFFWLGLVGYMPKAPDGASEIAKFGWILWRELPGIIVVVSYLALLPPFLGLTIFRGFYKRMGLIRFMVMSNLLLMMMLLPIKMVLRWTINLKYLISIPEYLLNL
ncbi:MAG: hypothetical protein O3C60_11815 [Planctomycetota bacterium]|nr:hypothetical protein [Planctomycetota bacterium]